MAEAALHRLRRHCHITLARCRWRDFGPRRRTRKFLEQLLEPLSPSRQRLRSSCGVCADVDLGPPRAGVMPAPRPTQHVLLVIVLLHAHSVTGEIVLGVPARAAAWAHNTDTWRITHSGKWTRQHHTQRTHTPTRDQSLMAEGAAREQVAPPQGCSLTHLPPCFMWPSSTCTKSLWLTPERCVGAG